MVRKYLIPLALFISVALTGCEIFFTPEHTNPFDPASTVEKDGYLLTATVSTGQIGLSWTVSQDMGFTQYLVISSAVRQDIRAAVLEPSLIPSLASVTVESTITLLSTTGLSLPTAGINGLRHYAVIYGSVLSDSGIVDPKASNIVTYAH